MTTSINYVLCQNALCLASQLFHFVDVAKRFLDDLDIKTMQQSRHVTTSNNARPWRDVTKQVSCCLRQGGSLATRIMVEQ